MSNKIPKNQLSFVRETLEVINSNTNRNFPLSDYNHQEPSSDYNPTVLKILHNRYSKKSNKGFFIKNYSSKYLDNNENKVFLDPYTQIYLCINILNEYIIDLKINKINENDIVEDLIKIRKVFENILNKGLDNKFISHQHFQDARSSNHNVFYIPLEDLGFHISILKKIENHYPKYEITEDELIQYQESINELINNIENSNLRENIKSKIIKNLLEIKEMIDNIYAFSREDIEKQIIYNRLFWEKLDDNEAVIKENKPKLLKFITDFTNNIVSKIKDPDFISENVIRALVSSQVGETVKKLSESIYKMLPPN